MTGSVVGFGASSMEGIGDPGGGFFSRLARDPALAEWTFHNLGAGGNTLADMLERAGRVAAFRPCDVVVLLGCNDLPRAGDSAPEKRSTPGEYAARAGRLFPALRGRRSLFVSSFAVSPAATGIDRETFETYGALARQAAGDAGFDIWDLYADSLGREREWLAADGLHFNARGHAFVAGRVADWVRRS